MPPTLPVIPDFSEIYGIEATPDLIRGLRDAHPAGVQLLRRNIESPDQVRHLVRSLRSELGNTLEFAVRHEGGLVTPFVRGVTAFPGLEALEVAGNAVLARDVGRAMGNELWRMGITMNLLSERGPMAAELAMGHRCVGIKAGVGPVARGGGKEPDEAEGAALAAAVAEEALHVVRDPQGLLPIPSGHRAGVIVPRLGDVAHRLPVAEELRMTAALLRPGVGASVAVLETAVQADPSSVSMAADWLAGQESGVLLCLDAHRFEGQRRLLDAVSRRCERLVVVTLANSADAEFVRGQATVLRACGFQACQLEAAMKLVFAPSAAGAGKRK